MNTTELAIVRGLTKRFGTRTVVTTSTSAVAARQHRRLLGAQRQRQTTTMRMLCGLLTPDGGEGPLPGLDFGASRRR